MKIYWKGLTIHMSEGGGGRCLYMNWNICNCICIYEANYDCINMDGEVCNFKYIIIY